MRVIYWNLTDRCNLRCKHCYLYDSLASPHQNLPHELGTEECLKIVEQFSEANVFYVSVVGGEPFCKPDIMVILSRMGEKKFWTEITTNSTLIDEKTAQNLADIGIKGIFASLEGPCAELNDLIRGKGSFKKALQGIEYLKDFEIPFRIQMTVTKKNCDKIEEMANFCLGIGAERIIFKYFNDIPSKDQFSSYLKLGREDIFAAAQKIAELKAAYADGFVSSDLDSTLVFLSSEPDPAVTDKSAIRCDLGSTQLGILSNGDVVPCIYMTDIVLGNVMKTHLSDIPNSPEFKRIKDLRKLTVDDMDEQCSQCEWKYVCGGGCRGRAYLKYGDLLSPDPQKCLLAKGELCE